MSDPYEAELGDDFDESVDDPDEAEAEQDEAELETLEGEEPEGEAEEEPPLAASRGDRRVQSATRTAAEAKREAAEAKQRADALERQLAEIRQQRQTPQESPEQIQARLAQMEPWERTEYLRQQDRAAMDRELAQMKFNQSDAMDKLAYEALKQRAPIAGKLEADVEKRLADMRASGTTAPRETVLRWVIGDRALANANRATSRAQKAAAGNRQRETARPTNARGDQTVSDQRGGSAAAARAKRLESYQL